jgi:hypothetical protein
MIVPHLDHLSYSNLNLFDQCPRCWYLKYVLGYQLPGSDAMELGRQVHEAIEHYHKSGGERPEPSYVSTFVETYSEMYKPEDFDMVEQTLVVPIQHPTDANIVLLRDGEELPLMVKIDRIWNRWISDTKTSSRKYVQADIDGNHQTVLYAYAYRTHFGEKEDGINFDVLVKNKVPKLFPMQTFCTDENIGETLQWVWDTWEKILAYPIPEYHTPHCWCPSFNPE